MNVVYALVCSATPERKLLFNTQELARSALKMKADSTRYRFGVHVIEDTEDVYKFLLGWEEACVSWRVVPMNVYESTGEAKTWLE
jgi:hypothetical protein